MPHDPDIDRLYQQYINVRRKLEVKLFTLPFHGTECHCDEHEETFTSIHTGHLFTEYHDICVNCGGYIIITQI